MANAHLGRCGLAQQVSNSFIIFKQLDPHCDFSLQGFHNAIVVNI